MLWSQQAQAVLPLREVWDVVDPDKKEKGNANMNEKDLLAELLSV